METFKRYPLPFDVYRKVLERLEKSDKELHSYMVECGFSVGESDYSSISAKLKIKSKIKREFWETVAEKIRDARAMNVDVLSSEMKLLSSHIVKDGTILMGGCGNGDITGWLKRNTDAEVMEMDYSPKMLSMYEKSRRTNCVLADCTKIPTVDAVFDQAVMIGIDANLNDRIFLNEINRVLKPDGKILMSGLCNAVNDNKPKSVVNYIRESVDPRKICDAFSREFMEKCYDDKFVQSSIFFDAESFEYEDKEIQESLCFLDRLGFDVRYEISKTPVMPRGSPYLHIFEIPYVIVGKKVQD